MIQYLVRFNVWYSGFCKQKCTKSCVAISSIVWLQLFRIVALMMTDFLKRRQEVKAYRVGLAHRRLSIIDLDSGHQPLCNEDGSIQIVFNGEIYNYQGLRKKLIDFGSCL